MKQKILILDDDDIATSYNIVRSLNFDYDIYSVHTAEEAFKKLRESAFQILLLDRNLGDGKKSGIELVPDFSTEFPSLCILMMTHNTDYLSVEKALKDGLSDYILKSLFIGDELRTKIPAAIERKRLSKIAKLHKITRDHLTFDFKPVMKTRLSKEQERINSLNESEPVFISSDRNGGRLSFAHELWKLKMDELRPFAFYDGSASVSAETEIFEGTESILSLARGGDVVLDPTRLDEKTRSRLITYLKNTLILPVRFLLLFDSKTAAVEFSSLFTAYSKNLVVIPTLEEQRENIVTLSDQYIKRHYAGRFELTQDAKDFLNRADSITNFKHLASLLECAIKTATSAGENRIKSAYLKAILRRRPKRRSATRLIPKSKNDLSPLHYEIASQDFEREYILAALSIAGSVENLANSLDLSKAGIYLKLKKLGINKSIVSKIKKGNKYEKKSA